MKNLYQIFFCFISFSFFLLNCENGKNFIKRTGIYEKCLFILKKKIVKVPIKIKKKKPNPFIDMKNNSLFEMFFEKQKIKIN